MITQEMIEHFTARTNKHIELVQKYLAKIQELNWVDNSILEKEMDHDASKFIEPEYTPYLYVAWKYKCQRDGVEFNPPPEVVKAMAEATFHHIKFNPHHPEYWDDSVEIDCLNVLNRDRPSGVLVNAINMPVEYVASMCADWLAMSEEKGTDPFRWAEDNINVRWLFTPRQVSLIYDILGELYR